MIHKFNEDHPLKSEINSVKRHPIRYNVQDRGKSGWAREYLREMASSTYQELQCMGWSDMTIRRTLLYRAAKRFGYNIKIEMIGEGHLTGTMGVHLLRVYKF